MHLASFCAHLETMADSDDLTSAGDSLTDVHSEFARIETLSKQEETVGEPVKSLILDDDPVMRAVVDKS